LGKRTQLSSQIAKIVAAMQKVADWMQNPKWVGNVKGIATTTFQDAGKGIPAGKCMMLQQASFYGNIIAESGATISPTERCICVLPTSD
jgi:alpha-glucoside transport system substrate-binding protein